MLGLLLLLLSISISIWREKKKCLAVKLINYFWSPRTIWILRYVTYFWWWCRRFWRLFFKLRSCCSSNFEEEITQKYVGTLCTYISKYSMTKMFILPHLIIVVVILEKLKNSYSQRINGQRSNCVLCYCCFWKTTSF